MGTLLNIILVLCVAFIIYELLKIIFIREYWKMCSSKRTKLILFIEGIYTLLLISMAFTKYWHVGLIVFIISLVTAYVVSHALRQKLDITKRIMFYMIVDGVLSILALLLPILSKILT